MNKRCIHIYWGSGGRWVIVFYGEQCLEGFAYLDEIGGKAIENWLNNGYPPASMRKV